MSGIRGVAAMMLILLAPPLSGAEPPVLPLGELPVQTLPAGRCALFLWDRQGDAGRRIVMVTYGPPQARVRIGGKVADLSQVSAGEPVLLGFAARARYAGAGVTLDLDLALDPNASVTGGAMIREGAAALTGADGATVVVPVAGLIGCR